jgi:hypothetical protein
VRDIKPLIVIGCSLLIAVAISVVPAWWARTRARTTGQEQVEIAQAVADFESTGSGDSSPSESPPNHSAPAASDTAPEVDEPRDEAGADAGDEPAPKPPKKPRSSSGKKPAKKPPATTEADATPDEPIVVPVVPSERDQALAALLKQFVDRHPRLELHGHVPDCDVRWAAHTKDIREGRLPTIASGMAIDDLISELQHCYRNHVNRWNDELKDLGLTARFTYHIETPEWMNFLARIREIAKRGK